MKLLIIFSLVLAGCAPIAKPNANVYGVNFPAMQMQGYNLSSDYDNNGNLTAHGGFTQTVTLKDLSTINGWICTDPPGIAAIKTTLSQWRDYVNTNCTCK